MCCLSSVGRLCLDSVSLYGSDMQNTWRWVCERILHFWFFFLINYDVFFPFSFPKRFMYLFRVWVHHRSLQTHQKGAWDPIIDGCELPVDASFSYKNLNSSSWNISCSDTRMDSSILASVCACYSSSPWKGEPWQHKQINGKQCRAIHYNAEKTRWDHSYTFLWPYFEHEDERYPQGFLRKNRQTCFSK